MTRVSSSDALKYHIPARDKTNGQEMPRPGLTWSISRVRPTIWPQEDWDRPYDYQKKFKIRESLGILG